MKKINHFKPNVKPTNEMAKRQWKWNYLRKMKRLYWNKKISRESFVEAAIGINLFTRIGINLFKRGGSKNATRV